MAIWSTGKDAVDPLAHAFTVGNDHLYDRILAPYDLIGSLAHVAMLAEIGLLPRDEADRLSGALRQLHREFTAGEWTVESGDEDVHTKVEALLTARLGAPGARLHTGRSRNDQVLTDLRMWLKHELATVALAGVGAVGAMLERARTFEFHPLPGYTHLQRAMPSSVGMFFAAHGQALLDDLILVSAAYDFADACPLGSGAGYGVGLPLDRASTGDLLGFARSGGVAMADANSRGKVETAALDAVGALVNDLSRLAADMVFFGSNECGFFSIGAGFTTGSSIMPQKRNPDIFELLRGRCSRYLGLRTALFSLTTGLPSGYSRDLQESKALVMDGLRLAHEALDVTTRAVPTLEPVRERILAALTPDIYATDAAYGLVVAEGIPFREAYRRIGRNLEQLSTPDHDRVVRSRTHAGSTGRLGIDGLERRRLEADATWRGRRDRLEECWRCLLTG